MEWIKCSKRMPSEYINVLVFADNKGTNEPKPYSIAMWVGNKWDFINHSFPMPNYGAWKDIGYPMDSEDVTHWMLLPPVPPEINKIPWLEIPVLPLPNLTEE